MAAPSLPPSSLPLMAPSYAPAIAPQPPIRPMITVGGSPSTPSYTPGAAYFNQPEQFMVRCLNLSVLRMSSGILWLPFKEAMVRQSTGACGWISLAWMGEGSSRVDACRQQSTSHLFSSGFPALSSCCLAGSWCATATDGCAGATWIYQ